MVQRQLPESEFCEEYCEPMGVALDVLAKLNTLFAACPLIFPSDHTFLLLCYFVLLSKLQCSSND